MVVCLIIWKAFKIRRAYANLKRAKRNAYRKALGLPPIYPFWQRPFRFLWRILKRIFLATCCRCLRRRNNLWDKVWEKGTVPNEVIKGIIGFCVGVGYSYFMLDYMTSTLNLTAIIVYWTYATLGFLLTCCLTFSDTARLLFFLGATQLFTTKGRVAMLTYTATLALAGPAKNTAMNMEVLTESLVCSKDMVTNSTAELRKLLMNPLAAIPAFFKSVKNSFIELAGDLKGELGKIVQEIMRLLNWVKKSYDFLRSITEYCNKNVGTPFQRCMSAFETASEDCLDKLGIVGKALCSPVDLFQNFCWFAKMIDVVFCWLPSLVKEHVFNPLKEHFKNFMDGFKTFFDARPNITYNFDINIESSKTLGEVWSGMKKEIREKVRGFTQYLDDFDFLSSTVFLVVVWKAFVYRHKFLSSDRFDNFYISKGMIRIDIRRKKMERATIFPLKYRESQIYVLTFSWALIPSERRHRKLAFIYVSLSAIVILQYILIDYLFYLFLELIKQYGNIQYDTEEAFSTLYHIEGDSFLAKMYKNILKGLEPGDNSGQGLLPSFDTSSCLPNAHIPDYYKYAMIMTLLFVAFIFAWMEPYALRMRHQVCGWMYEKRVMQREAWLYQHILSSRDNFITFAMTQIKARLKGDKTVYKVGLMDRISNVIPFCSRWFRPLTKKCFLCGQSGSLEDFKNFIECPNCKTVYCKECNSDMGQHCLNCTKEIGYEELDEDEEELGSEGDSDEDRDLLELCFNRLCRCSGCCEQKRDKSRSKKRRKRERPPSKSKKKAKKYKDVKYERLPSSSPSASKSKSKGKKKEGQSGKSKSSKDTKSKPESKSKEKVKERKARSAEGKVRQVKSFSEKDKKSRSLPPPSKKPKPSKDKDTAKAAKSKSKSDKPVPPPIPKSKSKMVKKEGDKLLKDEDNSKSKSSKAPSKTKGEESKPKSPPSPSPAGASWFSPISNLFKKKGEAKPKSKEQNKPLLKKKSDKSGKSKSETMLDKEKATTKVPPAKKTQSFPQVKYQPLKSKETSDKSPSSSKPKPISKPPSSTPKSKPKVKLIPSSQSYSQEVPPRSRSKRDVKESTLKLVEVKPVKAGSSKDKDKDRDTMKSRSKKPISKSKPEVTPARGVQSAPDMNMKDWTKGGPRSRISPERKRDPGRRPETKVVKSVPVKSTPIIPKSRDMKESRTKKLPPPKKPKSRAPETAKKGQSFSEMKPSKTEKELRTGKSLMKPVGKSGKPRSLSPIKKMKSKASKMKAMKRSKSKPLSDIKGSKMILGKQRGTNQPKSRGRGGKREAIGQIASSVLASVPPPKDRESKKLRIRKIKRGPARSASPIRRKEAKGPRSRPGPRPGRGPESRPGPGPRSRPGEEKRRGPPPRPLESKSKPSKAQFTPSISKSSKSRTKGKKSPPTTGPRPTPSSRSAGQQSRKTKKPEAGDHQSQRSLVGPERIQRQTSRKGAGPPTTAALIPSRKPYSIEQQPRKAKKVDRESQRSLGPAGRSSSSTRIRRQIDDEDHVTPASQRSRKITPRESQSSLGPGNSRSQASRKGPGPPPSASRPSRKQSSVGQRQQKGEATKAYRESQRSLGSVGRSRSPTRRRRQIDDEDHIAPRYQRPRESQRSLGPGPGRSRSQASRKGPGPPRGSASRPLEKPSSVGQQQPIKARKADREAQRSVGLVGRSQSSTRRQIDDEDRIPPRSQGTRKIAPRESQRSLRPEISRSQAIRKGPDRGPPTTTASRTPSRKPSSVGQQPIKGKKPDQESQRSLGQVGRIRSSIRTRRQRDEDEDRIPPRSQGSREIAPRESQRSLREESSRSPRRSPRKDVKEDQEDYSPPSPRQGRRSRRDHYEEDEDDEELCEGCDEFGNPPWWAKDPSTLSQDWFRRPPRRIDPRLRSRVDFLNDFYSDSQYPPHCNL